MEEANTPRSCDQRDCGCLEPQAENEISASEIEVSPKEAAILRSLAKSRYLPVCQFIMGMSTENEKVAALTPVFVSNARDDLVAVKEQGSLLKHLEESGLIFIDYDNPLSESEYEIFKQSAAFKSFTEVVNEGKNRKGFIFDTAELGLGKMSLTQQGEGIAQQFAAIADPS